ncbi:MAG: double zinc ribbon domain-containing protein, partial [Paracoccaceae bacterium]
MLNPRVQTALRVLFPPQCAGCNGPVGSEFALCGSCWVQVPIISGPICQSCGIPILADSVDDTDR